ncbi:GNAT family N-acetyltransferase [Microbacterium nymphoidis]|uniref:GNAT family N-acetyltransferase n=1 Tax=Microbacterium nymphoidis TaxID=2898586 RepID=UPI001E59EFC2|nr:GNAT family N-acetyltransferase [Microbacterium nymphoidis]MCD2498111.1 GNAT family N-acetyltransferase [Microbacterium nymphoidis]
MTQELAQAWVRGWATSRGAAVRREGDAWHVAVHATTRDEEYVLIEPSPAQIERTRTLVTGPRIWLTVLGAHEGAIEGWEVQSRVETLMDAPLRAGTLHPDVAIEVIDDVAHAAMMHDGVVTARGQVALAGEVAVLDRIETHPDHRRQGRGRLIVEALQAWVHERGARHGVLLASPDGRALYSALGWHDTMPAATFVRP